MCSNIIITQKNKYILEYLGYFEDEDQESIYSLWMNTDNSQYKLFDDYLLYMLREHEIYKHSEIK